jgi:biotin carboxyl carrier protein
VKSSGRRQGDSNNPSHLVCPLAGTLVEVLVEEGDVVQDYDAVAIVRQMKMELEVRAHRSGVVKNLWEMEEGEEVVAGMLVCEILDEEPLKEKL